MENKKVQNLAPRSAPVQGRSRERTRQILDATSELLEKVGFDDLTTILIAKAVGISVGSLYHYYPNKHAILHEMGSRWLEDIGLALDSIAALPVETLSVDDLLDRIMAAHLSVYKKQKAVLTLVQAMFAVPELRDLDTQHDELVISRMAEIFRRLGINRHIKERERLGRFYLEMTHAAFLVIVHQKGQRARRTQSDLKLVMSTWLKHQLSEAGDNGAEGED
ncbi:TetR/AcrR family transcriptional regulator [Thalassolituus sp. LLYu03]|uniref:TetR/AcrR family transcriptional regulator n=1 Tax=Thalassolituus sp. LLYu03 TaxID=3421656 RepID=UPI003D27891B